MSLVQQELRRVRATLFFTIQRLFPITTEVVLYSSSLEAKRRHKELYQVAYRTFLELSAVLPYKEALHLLLSHMMETDRACRKKQEEL